MAKRETMVNMRLMFSEDEHRKLKKMKEEAGLTWEEFLLKIAGIA
jgi:hypothetical protein